MTTFYSVILGATVGGLMAFVGAVTDDDANFWGLFAKYGALGVAVPSVVDLGSGKGFEFKPKEISVTLTKADGPPRVDTMVVDADDFRNVKWIRVRRDQAPASPLARFDNKKKRVIT